MERLTDANIDQALLPATIQQVATDVKEVADMLAKGTELMNLPPWYLLTKAAGRTGLKLSELYDDPVSRYHALGVLSADMMAEAKMAELAKEQG